jgi:peptidoglycan/LPS O-acetylase OafA/YrhL
MNDLVPVIGAAAIAAYAAATLAAGLVARAGFPLPPAERRLGCIDGLRGYLALSVLIHHVVIWLQVTRLGGTWSPPAVNALNQLGAGAVALFFMTTGFVFYPRVLAGLRASPWPAIYIGRVFRILPLVIASGAIVTVIIVLRTGRVPDGRFPLAALQWVISWSDPPLLGEPESGRINAYILWSLWYEWLFYLVVLPACAAAMDGVRGRLPSWVVPVALIAAAPLARALHVPGAIVPYLPLFGLGMLAYEGRERAWIAGLLRSPAMSLAAGAALGWGMVAAPTPYKAAMPLFGFFFACVACGNSLFGLLTSRGALVLGECSFGIYLLHGIVLSLIFVEGGHATASLTSAEMLALLPVAAILTAWLTAATYLVVERPAIALGRRLAGRWTGRRMRADAPELDVAP